MVAPRRTEVISCPIDSGRCEHANRSWGRQRMHQIIAGYEDGINADDLRHDSTLRVMCQEETPPEVLASQPTLSRLENRVRGLEIRELNHYLVETFVGNSLPRRTREEPVILDIDGTDDPAHGQQQLVMFNGFYTNSASSS